MPVTASIKLDIKQGEISIKNAVRGYVSSLLTRAVGPILRDIRLLIDQTVRGSDTYKSLTTGELRGEFGLRNANQSLEEIINLLQMSVNVQMEPVRYTANELRGGILIQFLKSDYSEILSSSAASYQSNQFTIEWLKWLLTYGDSIIIADYSIAYNLTAAQKARSRTGVALMLPLGIGWRVPPAWAGTADDNWLTKEFGQAGVQTQIEKIIMKALGV